MKQTYKKTFAVLAMASMVVLSSCGTVPTDEDPAATMKEARTNLVSEVTSSIDKDPSGSSMINFKGIATLSGMNVEFDGTTEAKSALENDTPASSIALKLNGTVDAPALGKSSGSVELEVITIAKMLYGKIIKAEATSANADIDAQIKQGLMLVSMYTGKWFKLDQAVLEQMSGAGNAVQSINKEEIKLIISELNNHEIFTLEEKLAPANGNFAYKVRLNADGIVSLVKAVSAKTSASTTMTDADAEELKAAIESINNEKGITHVLYIDATTKKYKKFESKGTVEKDGMKTTVSSVIESPKTDGVKWVASIEAVDTTANVTNKISIDMFAMDGKTNGEISVNLPGTSPVIINMNLEGTYNKKKVSIEAPADATDLTQMLGGATAPATSTGEVMMNTTDEAAMDAALENAMAQ